MSILEALIDAGELLNDISQDLFEWSDKTFGNKFYRGPIGPLKHLEKEVKEAIENPTDPMEYADCFLLILDAARRAGIKPMELMKYSKEKLEICKQRKYPELSMDNVNEPIEHLR